MIFESLQALVRQPRWLLQGVSSLYSPYTVSCVSVIADETEELAPAHAEGGSHCAITQFNSAIQIVSFSNTGTMHAPPSE